MVTLGVRMKARITYCRIHKKKFIFNFFFIFLFSGLQCVGHSFAYGASFGFLVDTLIRTQRAAVASRCPTNLATHLPYYYQHESLRVI